MPINERNRKEQKKTSEETKKAHVNILDKKIAEKGEKTKQIRKLESDLIEKEFKENLKDNLEQRMYDLKYKLAHLADERDVELSVIDIDNIIRGKNYVGTPTYTAEELSMVFSYYRFFITEINKIKRYIPSKKNFCAFVNISSATYDSYMTCGDTYKMETMKMIDDYITDIALSLAQAREIDNVTTIYRTKSEHGMVEATAPLVIKKEYTTDIDEIKNAVRALKEGKSLKNIELTPENYEVEE